MQRFLIRKYSLNSVNMKYSCLALVVIFSEILLAYSSQLIQNDFEESNSDGCVCSNYSCGCCAHLEVPKVGLNDTGCVNTKFLPLEFGISFTVTLDKFVIYNETLSVLNPSPPICFGSSYLKEFADLCVHFHDIDATITKLHGCVDIEARMHKVVVARYEIGCFNIGHLKKNDRWRKYHGFGKKIHSNGESSYNKIINGYIFILFVFYYYFSFKGPN